MSIPKMRAVAAVTLAAVWMLSGCSSTPGVDDRFDKGAGVRTLLSQQILDAEAPQQATGQATGRLDGRAARSAMEAYTGSFKGGGASDGR